MGAKFWIACLMLGAAIAIGSPKPAAAFGACLMDGSICVSPQECCSKRCMVGSAGGAYGICDPIPVVE